MAPVRLLAGNMPRMSKQESPTAEVPKAEGLWTVTPETLLSISHLRYKPTASQHSVCLVALTLFATSPLLALAFCLLLFRRPSPTLGLLQWVTTAQPQEGSTVGVVLS